MDIDDGGLVRVKEGERSVIALILEADVVKAVPMKPYILNLLVVLAIRGARACTTIVTGDTTAMITITTTTTTTSGQGGDGDGGRQGCAG